MTSAGVLLAAAGLQADMGSPGSGGRHGMPNFIFYSSFHVGGGQPGGPGGGFGGGFNGGGHGPGGGHGGGWQSPGGPEGGEPDSGPSGPEFVYHPGDCVIEQDEQYPPRQDETQECPEEGGSNQGNLIPSPGAATLGIIGLAGLIRKRRGAAKV